MTVVESAAPAEAALAVEGAAFAYPGRRVLDGLSLTVRPGEIYGLLGPNGVGKTTLIRAVCGRLALQAGSLRLGGRDPASLPEARRSLGLVPQRIALYGHLTVRENLEVFGRLAGLSRSAAAAALPRAAEACRLEGRLEERAGRLSGGLARRANIAAALLHRPALLLLDEPTVGIDAEAREAILAVLRSLADDGLAILLTTHELEQAERLCDRVGLLLDGRLRLEGPPRRLLEARFAGRRELLVELPGRADAETAARLRALGLAEREGGLIWRAEVAAEGPGLEAWSRRLAGLEPAPRELRLREPGLAALVAEARPERQLEGAP